MYDLVVSGGTVVTPAGVQQADVAVRGERIAAIGETGSFAEATARTIDAGGQIVIPGGIDPHLHYSMPYAGQTSETQEYSYAAAAGGTTTVIDFVFHEAKAEPYESPMDVVQRKKDEAAGRMAVDYGIHFAFTQNPGYEEIEQTGDIIRAGLPTIKVLTTYGWITDDGRIYGIMEQVAEHGGMSIAHAEDDAISNWLTEKLMREGKTHGGYISHGRPALVEEAAVRRLMLLAEATGSAFYVLHIAAASAVRALAEGQARGLPFYGETLTPYLSVTQDVLMDDENRGLLWNNFPTIKTQADQDELWRALADRRLSTVGSDHLGYSAAVRYEQMGTVLPSPQAGQAGSEMRLPVVYHLGVAEGRLSLERFVEVISTNPAKLMGLWPRKGQIAVGADADIAVIDPNATWRVSVDSHHMSADYNCWEGWELKGRVTNTILRGAVLYENGNYTGSKTNGQFIERKILPEHLAVGAKVP